MLWEKQSSYVRVWLCTETEHSSTEEKTLTLPKELTQYLGYSSHACHPVPWRIPWDLTTQGKSQPNNWTAKSTTLPTARGSSLLLNAAMAQGKAAHGNGSIPLPSTTQTQGSRMVFKPFLLNTTISKAMKSNRQLAEMFQHPTTTRTVWLHGGSWAPTITTHEQSLLHVCKINSYPLEAFNCMLSETGSVARPLLHL